MEFHGCLEGTKFFYVLENDGLAVNLEALLSEFVSDVLATHRAIDSTVCAHLGSDNDGLDCTNLLGKCESVVLNLLKLVGALLELLSEALLGRSRSDDSLAHGDKVVTAVTILYGHDVVLVAETVNIFFQNEFHILFLGFNYFIKSVTKGRRAKWRARFTA